VCLTLGTLLVLENPSCSFCGQRSALRLLLRRHREVFRIDLSLPIVIVIDVSSPVVIVIVCIFGPSLVYSAVLIVIQEGHTISQDQEPQAFVLEGLTFFRQAVDVCRIELESWKSNPAILRHPVLHEQFARKDFAIV